jgi:hypothetical protein
MQMLGHPLGNVFECREANGNSVCMTKFPLPSNLITFSCGFSVSRSWYQIGCWFMLARIP